MPMMGDARARPVISVVHGPNLNLLGTREPDVYGTWTLRRIDDALAERARTLGIEVRSAQSNLEGELVTWIQDAGTWASGVLLNPGGYSHTSVAIRDAVVAVGIPVVEVHMSNPLAREEFRQVDVVAGACVGMVSGFGWRSYTIALSGLVEALEADR
jgi:3-dehydroquinate dehydratase-2